jgi:hypothetical protein
MAEINYLAEISHSLARIADALERAVPVPVDHLHVGRAHPMINKSDVSVMTPAHAMEVEQNRATMAMTAGHHVRFGASESGQNARAADERPPSSRSGEWDHDDPLDDFPEHGVEWDNYAGVDQ